MAVVILGGLVTSTLLVLFVVPSAYLRLGSIPQHGSVDVGERQRAPSAGTAD
jgi:hypothetical protein